MRKSAYTWYPFRIHAAGWRGPEKADAFCDAVLSEVTRLGIDGQMYFYGPADNEEFQPEFYVSKLGDGKLEDERLEAFADFVYRAAVRCGMNGSVSVGPPKLSQFERLLFDLRSITDEEDGWEFSLRDLVTWLTEDEAAEWSSIAGGCPITAWHLSRHLHKVGITTERHRYGAGRQATFARRDDLEKAYGIYLSEVSYRPEPPSVTAPNAAPEVVTDSAPGGSRHTLETTSTLVPKGHPYR